tara:strand:+ start:214 stop:546 length:333 start_codon:yes stop_codon:yes gene_type:complete
MGTRGVTVDQVPYINTLFLAVVPVEVTAVNTIRLLSTLVEDKTARLGAVNPAGPAVAMQMVLGLVLPDLGSVVEPMALTIKQVAVGAREQSAKMAELQMAVMVALVSKTL